MKSGKTLIRISVIIVWLFFAANIPVPAFAQPASATINGYSPSSRIEVDAGRVALRVEFTNTGRTAHNFWGGVSVWDASGSLPPGLSLSSGEAISGTPTTAETYTFTVRDNAGRTAQRSFPITVKPAEGYPGHISGKLRAVNLIYGTLQLDGRATPQVLLEHSLRPGGEEARAALKAAVGQYVVVSGTYLHEEPVFVVSTIEAIPGGTIVTGRVDLPGRADDSGVTITIAGTGISTTSVADGSFTLNGVPAGAQTLVLSKERFLVRKLTVEVPATGTLPLPELVTLKPGDANNDNRVNIQDLTLLASSFRTAAGDERFNAATDFNADGRVNIQDLTLLAGSFRAVGDK